MTDDIPPELALPRKSQMVTSLLANPGFKEWFLPELQRRARAIELELCGKLTVEETEKKRAQYALLRELYLLARNTGEALRGMAAESVKGPVRNPGLE